MVINKKKALKLLLIASLVGTTFVLPTTFNTYHNNTEISVNAAGRKPQKKPSNQSKNNMPNDSSDDDNGQHGHFVLPKSYPAREGGNGNKSATIPKGTNLNYQLEPEGIDVWSKKYPRDDDYIIDNGGLKNSLKHHKKMPKGNANIAKANAQAKRKQQQAKNQAKLRAQQRASAKKSLPKTSDYAILTYKGYVAIFTIMMFLLGSLAKVTFSQKKDK